MASPARGADEPSGAAAVRPHLGSQAASPRSRERAAAGAARASCARPPARRPRPAASSAAPLGDLVDMADVLHVVGVRRSARPRTRRRGSPRAALAPLRSDSASTFASFHLRAPRAVSASPQSAARTPGTLFAAIDAPVPVQQQTMPWSARPSATSRAAASLAHAQSSRSSSPSAPCTTGRARARAAPRRPPPRPGALVGCDREPHGRSA